jgi:hypothetical protein
MNRHHACNADLDVERRPIGIRTEPGVREADAGAVVFRHNQAFRVEKELAISEPF